MTISTGPKFNVLKQKMSLLVKMFCRNDTYKCPNLKKQQQRNMQIIRKGRVLFTVQLVLSSWV